MNKMLNKKVVVFDFDGTLVDSMTRFAEIASKVMPKHYNIDSKTAYTRYLETSGIPFFEQLETIFPNNIKNKQASNEFETIKKQGYFTEKVFEDAFDTINALRKNNIKVVISSNNFQDLVDQFVNQSGIKCDLVLGYKNNFAKGEKHFQYIMDNLNCAKQEMIFVGDSLKDSEKAKSFGIDFIAKTGFFRKQDFEKNTPNTISISTLAELKEIL